MVDENWINEVFPEAANPAVHLDAATIDRLADILDLDRLDVVIGLRGTLRVHGYDVPPFEVRTNTWRIDLPVAVAHAVLGGVAGAAIIAAAGAPPLPTALVSLAVPFLLRIRRVELEARDVTVHAELTAAVRDEPHHLNKLYQQLPARSRAELTIGEFIEVVERLLDARLAAVGPDGVRLRARGRHRGFRLALTAPSLVPNLLQVTALPHTSAVNGSIDTGAAITPADPGAGLRLAAGRPRVFISYAQESDEHKRDVLAFAECLHDSGVGVILDQDTPPDRGDWQLWATKHITESDYVLVIASPTCRAVGDGTIDPQRNKGLQAEMRTLRELYNSDHPTWLRRMLPVILPGMTVKDIPLFLQPHNADHYKVVSLDPAGTLDLLRTLTTP
ncbi:TIR domain-containing protein [Dactylosporangium roseum]|uniref:TIR domain-containing protein n=1 Tax=Dactylosporangium roseum TaxID=47989 RepID=A0ABY5Z1Q7_9ACTN|nr:SEFIR domain-containing protein [Dactylosporangium roseum]UWZ34683.1 TIR domain-containing protein [Dactylosporangium roseum]